MLYREIIAASFENHTKHLGPNELCGQNIDFFFLFLNLAVRILIARLLTVEELI
jgi:hypothetical protein